MPAAASCHSEQPHQRRWRVVAVLESVRELPERIPLTFAAAAVAVASLVAAVAGQTSLLLVLPEPRTWVGTTLPCLDTHPTTTRHLALVWREW
jgi:hypothetical protein